MRLRCRALRRLDALPLGGELGGGHVRECDCEAKQSWRAGEAPLGDGRRKPTTSFPSAPQTSGARSRIFIDVHSVLLDNGNGTEVLCVDDRLHHEAESGRARAARRRPRQFARGPDRSVSIRIVERDGRRQVDQMLRRPSGAIRSRTVAALGGVRGRPMWMARRRPDRGLARAPKGSARLASSTRPARARASSSWPSLAGRARHRPSRA